MPRLTSGRSLLVVCVLAGLASAAASGQVAAQSESPVPDFSSKMAGWVNINTDFLPVAGAPAPTSNDPAHPYVSNQDARRAGIQPTFRVCRSHESQSEALGQGGHEAR